MVKLPIYEQQVQPDTAVIPSAPKNTGNPGLVLSSMNKNAEAVQNAAQAVGDVGQKLYAHAQKLQTLQLKKKNAEFDTQFRQELQDKLYSPDEETVTVNGQDITRPKGIYNRSLKQAEGSRAEFEDYYATTRQKYLSQVSDPEAQLALANSLDNQFLSARDNVYSHEAKQMREDLVNGFKSNISQQIKDAANSTDLKSLTESVNNAVDTQKSLNEALGLDSATAKLAEQKTIADVIESSTSAALMNDLSGATSMKLLDAAKPVLDAKDYDELASGIKVKSKKIIEDTKASVKLAKNINSTKILMDVAGGNFNVFNVKELNRMANNGEISNEAATAAIRAIEKPISDYDIKPDDEAFMERAKGIFEASNPADMEKNLIDVLDGFSSGNLSQEKMTLLFQAAQGQGSEKATAYRENFKKIYDWGVDAGVPVTYQSQVAKDYVEGLNAGKDPVEAAEIAIKRATASQNDSVGAENLRVSKNPKENIGFPDRVMTSPVMNTLFEGLTKFSQNRAVKVIGLGQAGMVEGVGGAAKLVGLKDFGSAVSKEAKLMQKTFEIKDPKFLDKLGMGASSSLSFFVPGLAVAKGVNMLRAAPVIAVALGVSTSSVMESSVEAGSNYEEAKRRGMTDEQAKQVGGVTFWLNMPLLVGTNVLGGLFNPEGQAIKEVGKKMTVDRIIKAVAEKGIKPAVAEGTQEGLQQVSQNVAIGDPALEGAREAAVIGAIVGSGLGAVTSFDSGAKIKDVPTVKPDAPAVKTDAPVDNTVKDSKGKPLSFNVEPVVENEIAVNTNSKEKMVQPFSRTQEEAVSKRKELGTDEFFKQRNEQGKSNFENLKPGRYVDNEGNEYQIEVGTNKDGIKFVNKWLVDDNGNVTDTLVTSSRSNEKSIKYGDYADLKPKTNDVTVEKISQDIAVKKAVIAQAISGVETISNNGNSKEVALNSAIASNLELISGINSPEIKVEAAKSIDKAVYQYFMQSGMPKDEAATLSKQIYDASLSQKTAEGYKQALSEGLQAAIPTWRLTAPDSLSQQGGDLNGKSQEGKNGKEEVLKDQGLEAETPKSPVPDSLFHETGSLDFVNATADATGLNVSSEPDLALGQSGKGILFEFDKKSLLTDRGSLQTINKPGTDFVGQKEFRMVGGVISPSAIKSVIVKNGTKLSKVDAMKMDSAVKHGTFTKEVLPNGDVKFTKTTGKPVSPLHAEALKYKTAEEFVASKAGYHVTSKKVSDKIDLEGIKSPRGKQFRNGKEESIPNEVYIWKDLKDAEKFKEFHEEDGTEMVIKKVNLSGLKMRKDNETMSEFFGDKYGDGSGYIVEGDIPKNALSSFESQLTAIYNEAHGGMKEAGSAIDREALAKEYADSLEQPLSDFHKKFVDTVLDKDINGLLKVLAQGAGRNLKSKKMFSKITGIKLPTTVSGIKETLYEYTKAEKPNPQEAPVKPVKLSQEEQLLRMKNARAEKTLQNKVRFDGKVVTKKQMIDELMAKGATPSVSVTDDENALRRLLDERRDLGRNGMQNINAKRIEEINQKIDSGVKKTEYFIKTLDSSHYVVGKTEYDYANGIEDNLKPKPEELPSKQKGLNSESGQVILPGVDQAAEFIQKLADPELQEGIYQKGINRFQSLENAAEKAKSLALFGLPVGEDPGLSATRYLSIANQSDATLRAGVYNITPGGKVEILSEGLKPILNDYEKSSTEENEETRREELNKYLVARRTVQDLQRPKSETDAENIVTPEQVAKAQADLDALQSKYGSLDLFDQTAQRVYAYQKALLSKLVESGAMSKENFDKILSLNPNYVPFNRILPEDEPSIVTPKNKNRFSGARSPIKKIQGSELEIEDVIESIIKNTYRIMDVSARNKVFKDVYNLKDIDALGIKAIAPNMQPIGVTEKETGTDDITIFRPSQFKPKGNIVEGFINGKHKYLEVPKNMHDAMTGLDEVSSGLLIKILSQPTNWLRTGATITPEFIARNPIRDQWTALLQTHVGFRPFVDPGSAIADIFYKREIYNDWIRSGGAYASFVELSRPQVSKMANELLGRPDLMSKLNIINGLQNVSQLMEQATRLGVYKAGIRSGLSPLEAAKQSRESTLDFARRGSNTKDINSLIAFFNAGVQSFDKMVRTAKEDPVGMTTKALVSITLPSLLLYLKNRDEDDYKELPRWQKDLFWMTKINGTWVRIPKPFAFGQIFGSMPERFMEYLETKDPKALDNLAQSLYDSLSPVSGDPASGLLPTGIKPLLENEANWSFFRQRAIVPMGQERLLPKEQYTKYDTETSKVLGNILNISPSKIENLVSGYFGGSGRYVLQGGELFLDTAKKMRGEEVPQKLRELSDVPLVKGFVTRDPVGGQSESVQKFYNTKKELNALNATFKKYNKDGDVKKADALLKSNPELEFSKVFDSAYEKMKNIDDRVEKITASNEATKEKKSKILELNKTKTVIAKDVLKSYQQFRGK